MMTNHDLIVFGEDWGALPSSTQHLVSKLAVDRKVLWVNSIGLRQPKINKDDLSRLLNKLTRFLSKSNDNTKLMDYVSNTAKNTNSLGNIEIVNPITIPAPKSKIARYIAKKLLVQQLTPIIKQLQLNKPILWLSLPTAVDLVGELNDVKTVYYCGDDFSALSGVDHKTVALRETELIEKADLIFAASEVLTTSFPNNKAHCIKHGVDLELFTTPSNRAHDLPNDGKPIAGFYGSINEWFDINLLTETAIKMPHWNFVIIGQVHIDISALGALNNVYFLGAKPHEQLPNYSQHWTASLLPFVLNKQIEACNPLKLSEYLAAGQPIISTKYPASEKYQGAIYLIENVNQMMTALEQCKADVQSSNYSDVLRSKVNKQSWSHQSQRVSALLESL